MRNCSIGFQLTFQTISTECRAADLAGRCECAFQRGGKKIASIGSVAHDAVCNSCEKQILGIRFKCGECANFSQCDNCRCLAKIHEHNLFPICDATMTQIPAAVREAEAKKNCRKRREKKKFSPKRSGGSGRSGMQSRKWSGKMRAANYYLRRI